jgi:hypothetical protein
VRIRWSKMMNAVANEPEFYRSEAFAEDVADLVATAPVIEPARRETAHRLTKALSAILALAGTALPRRRVQAEAASRRPRLARATLT